MTGKSVGKAILSILIIGWAILNLLPINDTPFEKFMDEQKTAHPLEYKEVIDQAHAMVKRKEASSFYLALAEEGKAKQIDFAKFFPNINLADVNSIDKRNEILLRHLLGQSQGKLKLGLDLKGGVAFTLKVDETSLVGKSSFEKEHQLAKAMEIIEKRVNGLGVAEPIIRAKGNDTIEVQLPGVNTEENPDVLQNLKKPAKLTFHLVNREFYPDSTAKGQEPSGYMVMTQEITDHKTGHKFDQRLFVKRIPEMGGSMIKHAGVRSNQYGAYEIGLTLTSDGTKRFGDITNGIANENHQPKYERMPDGARGKYGQLAIVLDGQLYSAPVVREAIPGGSASISGNFSQREAFELANVLNNPLEFELKLEEMYEVGPSLAEDARRSSINASLIGAGLVILFMILYYGSGGLVATVSVLLNIIIILGVLASIGSTLTLPGIAALVLTVGMAVDSNILIFERMREELRLGKNLEHALSAGYDRAFSTILDANITTFLTAAILIWLGTGPIKGFGVTLAIGIVTTLFSTLIISQLFLELIIKYKLVRKMLTISLFKDSKFDFFKYSKPAFLTSWMIVLAGLITIGFYGKKVLGIDFIGGDEVSIQFAHSVPTHDLYNVASNKGLGETVINYQKLIGADNKEILKIQTKPGEGREAFQTLATAFPQAKFDLIGVNTIGATVSESIGTNALLSLAAALFGILLYVAFRFEIGYGIGAIVSTIHDVVISIGIYVMLGGQFSAPMVAAILMIVGYSINDTIVVFDRIREELELNPTLNLKNVINIAINKTLSRTLLTSLTTFLASMALFIFGAGVVIDFALMFSIGIIAGTFSSIFIAAPVFFWWHKGDRKHVEAGEFKPKYVWNAGYTPTKEKTSQRAS